MNDAKNTPEDELTKKREQRRLEEFAQRALDDSVAELDNTTLAALANARQQALAGADSRRSKIGLLLGSSAIAAAMLVAVLWQQTLSPTPQQQALTVAELAAEEAWEVDEELLDDMEFYAWLAEQELAEMDQSHAG